MGGLSLPEAGIPADIIHADVHAGGSALAFNPAGTLLASGGWEGQVHLWSLPEGVRRGGWQAHDGSVNGLAFLESGAALVSAGYDRRIVLWDLQGSALAQLQTTSPVTALAVAAGRGLLASGHDNGDVAVCACWTGRDSSNWSESTCTGIGYAAWTGIRRDLCWPRVEGMAGSGNGLSRVR